MSIWSVQVAVEGHAGKPLAVRVEASSPEEALQQMKGAMREIRLLSEEPGGSEYTISVFHPGYREGDLSVVAAKVSLVTMKRGSQ
ncbi:hypothetical protein [Streptomyces sp. KL116D]|uniref:hypothetical protein n=1 Tax=Streptomyces sp. KL116D TaxID=3045152 RepID=UPI003558563E